MRQKKWVESLSLPTLLLILGALLVGFPILPAYATGAEIVQSGATAWPGTCNTLCSTTFSYSIGPSEVAAGDTLIASVHAIVSEGSATCGTPTDITDTLGTSWTLISALNICTATSGSSGFGQWVEIGIAPSTGDDTVSVTLGATVAANDADLTILDIAGIPSNYIYLVAGGYINSGSPVTTSNSIALPSVYFALDGVGLATNSCATPQQGFSAWSFGGDIGGYEGAANGCEVIASGVNPNITNPTDFEFTNVNGAAEFGIVFGAQPVQAFTVSACTAFELQCWLYPFFVFGVYMIFIVGMAVSVRVPGRDMTGHLLEAFSLAALLCVIMGILNVMVPLLVTVLQVVRAIRE
jgi:hypothetical protein